jgi:dihydrofolate synthase/folylpolyglutamate synthase
MPDTLDHWLAHVEALHPRGRQGIELGLSRVADVAARLGHRAKCPVITVAGTNGKGSVCAYLERILRRAGWRVGCYTSPHLLHYNERVRVDGRAAEDPVLCQAFARVEQARLDDPQVDLTYFEFGTLVAWEVFAAADLDVVILEVGLGGRLDAVNVYDADVAVLTSVGIDHIDYLGPDREAIGREKAGVFRSGRPAIVADGDVPASVLAVATALNADLRLIGRDFGFMPSAEGRAQWTYWARRDGTVLRRSMAYPGIRGRIQLANASAAIAALDCLRDRLPVSMQAVRQGLIETELAGRFQVIPGRPALVLDVAHNPQAAEVLAANLGEMGFFPTTTAVVGMMSDKDLEGSLRPLVNTIDRWCCASLPGPRGANAARLAEVLRGLGGRGVREFDTVHSALDFAQGNSSEADRIAAFGSFVTVAAVLAQRDRRSACG